jgi:hypothetical protein
MTMAALVAALVHPGPTPVAAQALPPEPTHQTRNGPRTDSQLRIELEAAGYSGPWDADSMLAAYGRAGLSSLDFVTDNAAWTCYEANPSCARDSWWAEWNELQDPTHITFTAIGSHLVSERRFAEAVDLTWQWPEGRTLLSQADRSGVTIIDLAYDQHTAFATYSPQRKLVAMSDRIATAPTWMVANVVAHELSHAADDAAGINQGHTTTDCLARETAAYEVQRRFLVWLTRSYKPDGLPTIGWVIASLPPEQVELANAMYQLGFSNDLPRLVDIQYRDVC